ncbi:DNA/RNA helicase, superfamily II (plasmid) [Deinococcus peraridilitoris DSM 19664]|uniref:DNA 3'-5' helicase n=2 Tax=Deinococcus TaxID=1298 RepID=L0A860_DEIPD|nr:DNA/RNA helicase, superfamily II [Deinococcus peraridilitoris DSM 19664]
MDMPRPPTLRFDRGTLTIDILPPVLTSLFTWDARTQTNRAPAQQYRTVMETARASGINIIDSAADFGPLELGFSREITPYKHQQEALSAWKQQGRRGVVVLPTGAGKTLVAQLAMRDTPRTTLILVPTLDLMHQWYSGLLAAFPDANLGLLGGGSHDETPLLIATYDSAAIHAEKLGNQYALLVFDEAHHLPADFMRVIAEYSIAPYRLGLTATPKRSDGREKDLDDLIGPVAYRRLPEELQGHTLNEYQEVKILVKLSPSEQKRYAELIQTRNKFLAKAGIQLGSLDGWKQFIASCGTPEGRRAMLAHREARKLAYGTDGKLRVLEELLQQHLQERTIIFTDDNATVYRISHDFLIPCITHQTPVKERHKLLEAFRKGEYRVIVTSRVLNEGVDVPEASIAIVLSGTATEREHIQRLGRILRKVTGKKAVLYELVTEGTSEEHVSQRRRGQFQQTAKQPRTTFAYDIQETSWENL